VSSSARRVIRGDPHSACTLLTEIGVGIRRIAGHGDTAVELNLVARDKRLRIGTLTNLGATRESRNSCSLTRGSSHWDIWFRDFARR
jgi:hypothetical protein